MASQDDKKIGDAKAAVRAGTADREQWDLAHDDLPDGSNAKNAPFPGDEDQPQG